MIHTLVLSMCRKRLGSCCVQPVGEGHAFADALVQLLRCLALFAAQQAQCEGAQLGDGVGRERHEGWQRSPGRNQAVPVGVVRVDEYNLCMKIVNQRLSTVIECGTNMWWMRGVEKFEMMQCNVRTPRQGR